MRKTLIKNEFLTVSQELNWYTKNSGYVIDVDFDAFYQVFTNQHVGLFKELGFEFHFCNLGSKYDYIIRKMRCKVTKMQEKKELVEKVKELVIYLSSLEKLEDRDYIYKNNWQFNDYSEYFQFFKDNIEKY